MHNSITDPVTLPPPKPGFSKCFAKTLRGALGALKGRSNSLLAWPSVNLSLLQNPVFQFVWLHCVSSIRIDVHLSTAPYPHLTSLRLALQISAFSYQASGRQTRCGLKAMMLWRSNKLTILEKDSPIYLDREWLSGLGEELCGGANTSLVLEPDGCVLHSLSSSTCRMHTRVWPWDPLIQKSKAARASWRIFFVPVDSGVKWVISGCLNESLTV